MDPITVLENQNALIEDCLYTLETSSDIAELRSAIGDANRILNMDEPFYGESLTDVLDAIELLTEERDKNQRTIDHMNAKITLFEDIEVAYNARPPGTYLIMEIGGEFWTLTSDVMDNLQYMSENEDLSMYQFTVDSDRDFCGLFSMELPSMEDFTLHYRPIGGATGGRKSNEGGFFGYTHDTIINLKDLQIYTEKELKDPELQKEINKDCLISTLEHLGVSEKDVHRLCTSVSARGGANERYTMNRGLRLMPKKHLNKVAEILKRRIYLHDISPIYNEEKQHYNEERRTYGDKSLPGEPLCIALFLSHYFPRMPVHITPYALKNYKKIVKEPNGLEIRDCYNGSYRELEERAVTQSKKVVLSLHRREFFKRSSYLVKHDQYVPADTYQIPDELEEYQIEVEAPKKRLNARKIYFFDIETTTEGHEHTPYLYGIMAEDEHDVQIFTDHYKMLDWVVRHTKKGTTPILYAHNAKYDYSAGFPGILRESELVKEGQFYQARIKHQRRSIEIRDTYKHLIMPLSKFRSTFELDIGKKDEFIPYDLYTKVTVNQRRILLKRLKEHPKYVEELHADLIAEYISGRGRWFNHMEYMKEYLRYDVLTLKAGFLKQRESLKGVTGLDLFDHLTSSSLADTYFKGKGCYKGVYELHGELKDYVMRSVIGGRVMTRNGYKYKLEDKAIMDFDAVSLYPSAIAQLKTPVGRAEKITKIIPDSNYDRALEELGDVYYIVEITINKVRKDRPSPFMTVRGSKGERLWTNDMSGICVVVDRTTLEDYVEFHEISYTYHQGVYWKEQSTAFAEEMVKLFQHRLDAKAELKAATTPEKRSYYQLKQQSIKNLMNMSYGKNGIKETATRTVFRPTALADAYITKNFQQIMKYNVEKNYHRFTVWENIFNQGNRCHIAAAILSLSKRIMNRVMAVADKHNIPIFYQDTDSMHLYYDDVAPLGVAYKDMYDMELIGKGMGQFHNDLENDVGEPCVSVLNYTLGKKCYLDRLITLKDYLAHTKDPPIYYHIRMKGIGSQALLANYNDVEKVYEMLYNDEAVPFDLLKSGVKFDVKTGVSVSSRRKFMRVLQFAGAKRAAGAVPTDV